MMVPTSTRPAPVTPSATASTSAFGNVYQFAGRRFDAAAGLYYNRHRYYEPRAGRFTARDPLGYADGRNLYAYARSNPLAGTDPLGLKVNFVDCEKLTKAQKADIKAGVKAACDWVKKAVNILNTKAHRGAKTKGWSGADKIKYRSILKNEARLKQILRDAKASACDVDLDVECECACKEGTDAYTRGCTWGSLANLHLCPPFFTKKQGKTKTRPSTLKEKTETLFHEITHYGCSEDDANDPINAHQLEKLIPWLVGTF